MPYAVVWPLPVQCPGGEGVVILDLFAGPGGWDLGLEMCGRGDVVGIEWDDDACATRRAVGFPTIQADVAAWPERLMPRAEGLIASPPCQAFSAAGKRKGHLDADRLLAFADRWARDGWSPPGDGWADVRTPLILEPMRYIDVIEPEWVAMEQVAPALPFFQAMLDGLDKRGYSASVAVLQAEAFGVPQTRKRCFLVAHRGREVAMPVPTHSRYHPRSPERLDSGVLPWVSMAEALGWTDGCLGFARRDDLGTSPDGYRERDWRHVSLPPFGLTEKARSMVLRGASTANATVRSVDAPAPTLLANIGKQNGWEWTLHKRRDQRPDGSTQTRATTFPAPGLTTKAGQQWQWHGPATTVAGDPRITSRSHHYPGEQGRGAVTTEQVRAGEYDGKGPVKLTIEEASVLQTFPADYPWAGTKTAKFRQCGDAVPPLLAAAVLGAVL